MASQNISDEHRIADKARTLVLLDRATKDFSSEGFSENELKELKYLVKKHDPYFPPVGGGLIEHFTRGEPFGISQPEKVDNIYHFLVTTNNTRVNLSVDENGDIFM